MTGDSLDKAIISIHAPTRGATYSDHGISHIDEFQSTLPQGERPDRSLTLLISSLISIHAPTRGATFTNSTAALIVLFQSTLPQGERHRSGFRPLRVLYFNPRSHKGSDLLAQPVPHLKLISIHAPTRGATFLVFFCTSLNTFQSTLPQGERRQRYYRLTCMVKFQSTLPQGERRLPFYYLITVDDFNPRSHKGSDSTGRNV